MLTLKNEVQCKNCNTKYFINKSSLRQYFKRNNTTDYICLQCKNRLRPKKSSFKIKTCVICGVSYCISGRSNFGKGYCIKCWQAERLRRAKVANQGRKVIVTDNMKSKLSATISYKYKFDKEYLAKQMAYRNQEWRDKISVSIRKKWSTGGYEEIRNGNMRNTWLQRSLRMLCESLGINYAEEYVVDVNVPYSFDFRIGNILIELDGDYWHSLKNVIANDKRKESWIQNNHPEFQLIRIKEHEAKCVGKLYNTIIKILDISIPDFEFNDITIRPIERNIAVDFINAYHYIGKPRPGGLAFGAYISTKLIMVILFQRPMRQQSAACSGSTWNHTYEISRLVVTPGYNKKNLISYSLSRAIKMLPNDTNLVISFADSTYGHDGSCYKAANFILERIVRPDYHYEKDGVVMHKKTLWDHAKKMGMNERDYVIEHNYIRVQDGEKYKYTYIIK